MLDSGEYKQLLQIKPWRAWLDVLADWLLLATIFYVSWRWSHPLVLLVAVVLVARTQLALSVLMHEASHKNLFKNLWLNDFVGQFFIAGPVFFSMYSYKRNHMVHHQIPLQEKDPDITLTGGYPISSTSMRRKLLRDLFGVSYFKFMVYFLYGSHKRSKKVRKQELPSSELAEKHKVREKLPTWAIVLSIALANGGLVAMAVWSGKPWLYLVLWLLPLITVLQVFLRVRGIAEHAGYQPQKDQLVISRTVVNPLQTFFVAPHNVNYHIEHHAYPKIPWYNLGRVHQIMTQRNSLPPNNVYKGYGPILDELVAVKAP